MLEKNYSLSVSYTIRIPRVCYGIASGYFGKKNTYKRARSDDFGVKTSHLALGEPISLASFDLEVKIRDEGV